MVSKIEKPVFTDRAGKLHDTLTKAATADAYSIFEQTINSDSVEPWLLSKLAQEWVILRQHLNALHTEMQWANGTTTSSVPSLVYDAFMTGQQYIGSEKPEDIAKFLSGWLDDRNKLV